MKSLADACAPRPSVFDRARLDTVYSLDDLDSIDPRQFFAENYPTEGMRQLLTEGLKRLEGRSASAPGAFLLSQSMGGGKTHNLIALGLLAKYPEFRPQVTQGFYTPGPLGAVRVVAFSGRTTNTPFGIWGEIADGLNKKEALSDFYSPLLPPGPEDWVNLLRGEPLLILLDELPPYFEAIRAKPVGATTLDTITTTALANLLVAVTSGKLPNVCLVMTDLRGQAYGAGSAAVNQALSDLEKETNRGGVVRIDPVRINTHELYHVLAVRLFEKLPGPDEIEAVADAYAKELERAQLMDATEASPQQLRAEITAAYPFHPAIRDLYARFKENPGFQQTRALIRIMRLAVADLWNSGKARERYLIGAEDLDLHRAEVLSEIRQINPSLEAAIAHDIAAEGGGSVAEIIDGESGEDAQDVAKLILLSSLSQAVSPTLGLTRSEIVQYLMRPGRDVGRLREIIDRLQSGEGLKSGAWYLHSTGDGKLLFKNTQNLNAKLDSYTRGLQREQAEAELRDRLKRMFEPTVGACYQQLFALPALDQVSLQQDAVSLVIFRPSSGVQDDVRRFWEQQQYRNRVCFLTGSEVAFETVLQRARELKAIQLILDELRREGHRADDPQLTDAQAIETRKLAGFYQACRETFQTLLYPSSVGLTPLELDPQYVANEYKGEDQVIQALKGAYKYRDEVGPDSSFKTLVETKLWPNDAKEVAWTELKRRAATDPSWVWHHPRALDALRDELVKRDLWRLNGSFVERGPFPTPAPTVQVQVIQRSDDTGETLLRVRPLHGDLVRFSASGPPSDMSERLQQPDLTTRAVRLWFRAYDSRDPERVGDVVEWTTTLSLKYRLFSDGSSRRCELRAIPEGAIRYTTDGSSPETSGILYTEPFIVPSEARVILAVAEAKGVRSQITKFDLPVDGRGGVSVDPNRPATWRRRHQRDDTSGSYAFLEAASRRNARLAGISLVAARDQRWVHFASSREVALEAPAVVEEADRLKGLVPDGNLDFAVEELQFDRGADLAGLLNDLRLEISPGELIQ